MTTLAFSAPLGATAQRRAGRFAAPHVLDANSLGDHLDRLYRAALGLTGNAADAEDLVQDACLRVLAKPRLVSGDDDLGYLLRRAAQHVHLQPPHGHPPPRDGDRAGGPRALRGHRDRRPGARVRGPPSCTRRSRAADHQRDVLVAVDLVGLSYKEAAESLGVPTGTIMSRLYRARQSLVA